LFTFTEEISMKKLLFFAATMLLCSVANAANTEVGIQTYPQNFKVYYDSDRDNTGGDIRPFEVYGAQPNGALASGATTSLGVVAVRGALYKSGLIGSPYFQELFDEGAAAKGIRLIKSDATAYSGNQLILNWMYLGNGGIVAVENIGGSANTGKPVMTAVGLDISSEQTSGDGMELSLGWAGASGKAYVVGTDPAFYTCATFKVTDASGANPLVVGFRALEPSNATIANYTEYAYIGIIGTSNPNLIKITTEVDANLDGTGDGATVTDTTDTFADLATKTFCTFVSGAGVVTYTNNGAAPTATAAATLTDGMMVVPFIYFLNAADLVDTLEVTDWEDGYTGMKPFGT
jgi:hypothetical protein